MQHAIYKIFLVGLISACASCNDAPKVDVCISDPANNQMACVDRDKKSYVLPYAQSENYVCLVPEDLKTVLEYCKVQRQGN